MKESWIEKHKNRLLQFEHFFFLFKKRKKQKNYLFFPNFGKRSEYINKPNSIVVYYWQPTNSVSNQRLFFFFLIESQRQKSKWNDWQWLMQRKFIMINSINYWASSIIHLSYILFLLQNYFVVQNCEIFSTFSQYFNSNQKNLFEEKYKQNCIQVCVVSVNLKQIFFSLFIIEKKRSETRTLYVSFEVRLNIIIKTNVTSQTVVFFFFHAKKFCFGHSVNAFVNRSFQ